MAFFLVALVCALVVGNAVRTSTLQRLVGGGLPLSVLVPIAPPNLLDTIHASGANGRYLDPPFLGTAISAVGDVPAPPSVPAPVTTAVVTVSAASPTTVVQTAAAPAAVVPAAAATSTRPAGRHHAAPRRAVTASSGTPTVAPARGTPTLTRGGSKHGGPAIDKRGPTPAKAVSHELKRAQHEAEKAAHRQARDQKHAIKAETKHAGKPHHQKPHHQKPHHQKPHHEKRHPVKPHHEKRHPVKPHHEKRHHVKPHHEKRH
jgi:hypothetical protein